MSHGPGMGLAGLVSTALSSSPFRAPSRWALAVVVVRLGEAPVARLRGDFAGWLRSNDLGTAAHECIKRKVPTGSILTWLEADTAEASGAGFHVLDLRAVLRRFR